MKKLRLLITPQCDRACEGCCNKDWDIKNLPIAEEFTGYDVIMFTGGEPLLKPDLLFELTHYIRQVNPKAELIIYTAMVKDPDLMYELVNVVDGITLTIHEQEDAEQFFKLDEVLATEELADKSLRLNIFDDVEMPKVFKTDWILKDNMKWVKDCPLPTDEVFMQLAPEHQDFQYIS